MAKIRNWIGAVSAPILLISAGCSVTPRHSLSVHRRHSPERLMSMAQAYERQGQIAQAQNAYLHVLAVQPGNPSAQQSLDALIARQNSVQQPPQQQASVPPRELFADSGLQLSSTATKPLIVEPELAPPPPVLLPPVVPAPAPMTSGMTQLHELARQDANSKLATSIAPEASPPEQPPAQLPELSAVPSMVQVAIRIEAEIEVPPSPIAASDVPPLQIILEPPASVDPIRIPPSDESVASLQLPSPDPAPAPPSTSSLQIGVPALPIELPDVPKVIDASHHETSSTQASSPPVESHQSLAAADDENLEFVLPLIANGSTSQHAGLDLPRNHGWISAATPICPPIHDAHLESAPFLEPLIAADGVTNVQLKPFFGPFHVQLIANVRAHRDQLQGKLVELVTDAETDADIRSRAVFLLGSIGPDASDAVPAMQRELKRSHDVFFKMTLAEAILKIDHENQAAIAQLIECLSSNDTNVRWIATFALRNASSPHRTTVVDHLRVLLVTEDRKVQRMVLLTLAELGPTAVAAAPEVEGAIQSLDSETKEIARACLASITSD